MGLHVLYMSGGCTQSLLTQSIETSPIKPLVGLPNLYWHWAKFQYNSWAHCNIGQIQNTWFHSLWFNCSCIKGSEITCNINFQKKKKNQLLHETDLMMVAQLRLEGNMAQQQCIGNLDGPTDELIELRFGSIPMGPHVWWIVTPGIFPPNCIHSVY